MFQQKLQRLELDSDVTPAAQRIREYEAPLVSTEPGIERVPVAISRREFEGSWTIHFDSPSLSLPALGVVL